ncbi:MAG: hypothetical protein AAGD96_14725 [Chloroflexota bacterium]
MNLKPEIRTLLVYNAPKSFDSEIELLDDIEIIRDPAQVDETPFGLAFAITLAELEEAAEILATKTKGDALVWIAYPKGSSKKYKGEFNRDTSWAAFGKYGFEGVRQVAIDADWSALRFRRVEFIKTMKRDPKRAISKEGKKRTQDNG